MPGTSVLDDIELIIEDIGGGGKPPAGRDGGDSGGGGRRVRAAHPRGNMRCHCAGHGRDIGFLPAMAVAFLVLRIKSPQWKGVPVPALLWFNTIVC